jgi:hypothetical protein
MSSLVNVKLRLQYLRLNAGKLGKLQVKMSDIVLLSRQQNCPGALYHFFTK